ncbi:hypothetical protein GCM10028803_05770 [Larkinella knui]|uniref:Uncharacterized protein n=1 Tax=Larkinella knui TaxID=2025310 RepID=A0A3P1CKK5_9BACT|nr:hypothetical protein [Larkinella knui]RRB13748.1 hypothetical protein EHT87_15925 [Larkinella knui]
MKLTSIIDTIRHGVDLLKGEETVDKTYCSDKTHADEPTAQRAFDRAKEKLFAVDRWSDLSSLTADFHLYDQAGNRKTTGSPVVGDYIKVDLPGPAPENWVKVIHIIDEETRAGFTARPCADPNDKAAETEHFFSDTSTSTFHVEREGLTITACQIGKNERVNNEDAESGNRGAVNTVIAGAGWLFYQKIQWKTLTAYLVEE